MNLPRGRMVDRRLFPSPVAMAERGKKHRHCAVLNVKWKTQVSIARRTYTRVICERTQSFRR